MQQQIGIKEAAQQLQECSDEVGQIRQRIRELQESNSAIELAKCEREISQRLLEGGNVAEIVMPPMTSTQLRMAVQVLESRLVDALERESQAKGALRAAKMRRLRELYELAVADYDKKASELVHEFARATALGLKIESAVGGVSQLPLTWHRLTIPRGGSHSAKWSAFDSGLHPQHEEIMNGNIGNKARSDLNELLNKEGIK